MDIKSFFNFLVILVNQIHSFLSFPFPHFPLPHFQCPRKDENKNGKTHAHVESAAVNGVTMANESLTADALQSNIIS